MSVAKLAGVLGIIPSLRSAASRWSARARRTSLRFPCTWWRSPIRRLFPVPVVLFFVAPQIALGAESVVSFSSEGHEVVGTLLLPEGPPAPVVLLLHGFVGSRDDLATKFFPDGIFPYAAARMADAGYASLRIDFRGGGDSTRDMSFSETTFETQISDAVAAIEFLRASEAVNGDESFVVGWSLGGLIAASMAGRTQAPKAVALWNGIANPRGTFGRSIGADNLARGRELEPGESLSLTLSWGPDITLERGFFDDVATHEPLAEVAQYTGALLVVQGLEDTQVLPEDGEAYHQAHQGAGQHWTAEMDHVFNAFNTDETFREVVDVTIAFFDNARE